MMVIDWTVELYSLVWGIQAAFLISAVVLIASAVHERLGRQLRRARSETRTGNVVPLPVVQTPTQRIGKVQSGSEPCPEAA